MTGTTLARQSVLTRLFPGREPPRVWHDEMAGNGCSTPNVSTVQMFRICLCSFAVATLLATSARAQAPGHPSTVTPDGAAPLSLTAHATRVHLLGLVEMYSLALYVDPSMGDRADLASRDVPKALRIEIKYKDDLRRRVSIDWRRELIPALNADATAQLRATYAPLRFGDVVLVEYVPANGTTLRVNTSAAGKSPPNR